jgi:hypothetical protein
MKNRLWAAKKFQAMNGDAIATAIAGEPPNNRM